MFCAGEIGPVGRPTSCTASRRQWPCSRPALNGHPASAGVPPAACRGRTRGPADRPAGRPPPAPVTGRPLGSVPPSWTAPRERPRDPRHRRGAGSGHGRRQKANSGHPGTAMALAPLAHVLFTRIMRYDAADPEWPDRDRFVLSAGHASILLYSMLYLTGYGLEPRRPQALPPVGLAHARPPRVGPHRRRRGHHRPARPGLRQRRRHGHGRALTCGPASAPRCATTTPSSSARDGDLMEGISHEAGSLAGHLGLGRLVAVYDDNHITIDGPTELALTDDAAARFEAYGWHVERDRRGRQRPRRPRGRPPAGHGRRGPPVADRAAQPHRLPVAQVHRHPEGPRRRRSATTRSPRTKEILGSRRRALLGARRRARPTTGEAGAGAPPSARRGRSGWRAAGRRAATGRGARRLPRRARPGGLGRRSCRQWPAGEKLATRVACRPTPSTPSLDVVPGLIGGGADLTGNTGTAARAAPAPSTPRDRRVASSTSASASTPWARP